MLAAGVPASNPAAARWAKAGTVAAERRCACGCGTERMCACDDHHARRASVQRGREGASETRSDIAAEDAPVLRYRARPRNEPLVADDERRHDPDALVLGVLERLADA